MVYWISRIFSVFQHSPPNVHTCSIRSLNLFNEYENHVCKRIAKKLCKPVEVTNGAVGYFDGVSTLYYCGCGFVLNLSKEHSLYIFFGGGHGSNTKAELLSLYGLPFIASLIFIGVSDIGIYLDSKIIMDWQNGLTNLQLLSLNHWIHKIQLLKQTFVSNTFSHISRCFKASADSLSKATLSHMFGSEVYRNIWKERRLLKSFFI